MQCKELYFSLFFSFFIVGLCILAMPEFVNAFEPEIPPERTSLEAKTERSEPERKTREHSAHELENVESKAKNAKIIPVMPKLASKESSTRKKSGLRPLFGSAYVPSFATP